MEKKGKEKERKIEKNGKEMKKRTNAIVCKQTTIEKVLGKTFSEI